VAEGGAEDIRLNADGNRITGVVLAGGQEVSARDGGDAAGAKRRGSVGSSPDVRCRSKQNTL
jgi:hypothetical protein